jgi:VIT1/CCC1 family predicted Fe2+/Mn2+ transporter
VKRGLDPDLALKVAKQLTERDALGSHARDELGLSIVHTARPVQAALASAVTFAAGAALPLILAAVVSLPQIILAVPAGSLFSLAALGALSAKAGGARRGRAVLRVTFWGALAMALTAAIGRLFGTVV